MGGAGRVQRPRRGPQEPCRWLGLHPVSQSGATKGCPSSVWVAPIPCLEDHCEGTGWTRKRSQGTTDQWGCGCPPLASGWALGDARDPQSLSLPPPQTGTGHLLVMVHEARSPNKIFGFQG